MMCREDTKILLSGLLTMVPTTKEPSTSSSGLVMES